MNKKFKFKVGDIVMNKYWSETNIARVHARKRQCNGALIYEVVFLNGSKRGHNAAYHEDWLYETDPFLASLLEAQNACH